jgi:hypothetical protein
VNDVPQSMCLHASASMCLLIAACHPRPTFPTFRPRWTVKTVQSRLTSCNRSRDTGGRPERKSLLQHMLVQGEIASGRFRTSAFQSQKEPFGTTPSHHLAAATILCGNSLFRNVDTLITAATSALIDKGAASPWIPP